MTMLWSWKVAVALLPVGAIAAPSSPSAFVTTTTLLGTSSTYLEQLNTRASTSSNPIDYHFPLGRSFAQRPSCEINRLCGRCSTTVEPCLSTEARNDHDVVNSLVLPCRSTEAARDEHDTFGSSRQLRKLPGALPAFLATATTVVVGSQPSMAAVTGGRIGGGYNVPEQAPSAPPIQRQQQLYRPQAPQQYGPPRAGRDIFGSDGSRVHIKFSGNGGRRRGSRARFNPDVGDVTSNAITPGDVIMVGGVSAGIAAVQRYHRKKLLEEEGLDSRGASTVATGWSAAPMPGGGGTAEISTLQLAMYCDRRGGQRDVLDTLNKLSQTADVNSSRGLSTLVNEVCLALLRSERDWIGSSGSIKEYPREGSSAGGRGAHKKGSPRMRAKRDFNRFVMRERSKWERETVSNTPERGFSSSTAPGWREDGKDGGTYAVATLMIAWAGLRSTPPRTQKRERAWFWQDDNRDREDRDVVFSVTNRKSTMALLEWLGDEAAEGRGENVLDVEVLWTPADPDDSLDRDALDTKWPELRAL